MTLVISESYINATTECRFGDSGWQEPYTDDIGRLYKDLQSEYGRCTGHVYVDTTEGDPVPVGWVFIKRMEYEDFRSGLRSSYGREKTYLREVWVSVGERDDAGEVWRYDVKRHKGTMPAQPSDDETDA
jgi:hypothetical protein